MRQHIILLRLDVDHDQFWPRAIHVLAGRVFFLRRLFVETDIFRRTEGAGYRPSVGRRLGGQSGTRITGVVHMRSPQTFIVSSIGSHRRLRSPECSYYFASGTRLGDIGFDAERSRGVGGNHLADLFVVIARSMHILMPGECRRAG